MAITNHNGDWGVALNENGFHLEKELYTKNIQFSFRGVLLPDWR